jgi:Flp pilus assembly pilin Flp
VGESAVVRRGDGDGNLAPRVLLQDEGGGTAIEYGLIAALISVVIIGAITAVGTRLTTTFTATPSPPWCSSPLSGGGH